MIQRRIYQDIKAHLLKPEITILTGPRQIGKTTLMKLLTKEEVQRKFVWFNLDLEKDFENLRTQERFLSKIDLQLGDKGGIVFIDEIQRKEDAGRFLKGIYDSRDNLKFIISGSGSLELKEKLVESLAGRKRMFNIFPITFEEFLDYKTEYLYTDRLYDFKILEKEKVRILFDEYTLYGGYPKVVTTALAAEKKVILLEILNSYLLRDIRHILSIHNYEAYNKLLNIVSQQVGMPAKYSGLSQYVSLSANTVKEYLWYMEHTFMIRKSIPYYTNPLKELIKEPVLYYYDIGMLNMQRNNFMSEEGKPSFGFIFQNYVFNELHVLFRKENIKLKYWRTKDKAEVDIVLEIGSKVFPVEVKYIAFPKPKISRAFRSFIERYSPKVAFIITKEGDFNIDINGSKIYFLPFYKLENVKLEVFNCLS